MVIGKNSLGAGNILLKLGKDGMGIRNTLLNVGNDGLGGDVTTPRRTSEMVALVFIASSVWGQEYTWIGVNSEMQIEDTKDPVEVRPPSRDRLFRSMIFLSISATALRSNRERAANEEVQIATSLAYTLNPCCQFVDRLMYTQNRRIRSTISRPQPQSRAVTTGSSALSACPRSTQNLQETHFDHHEDDANRTEHRLGVMLAISFAIFSVSMATHQARG